MSNGGKLGDYMGGRGSNYKSDINIKDNVSTDTQKLTDYVSKTLSKMGFDVERKHSNLSDSEYISIKGAGDLFGKDKEDSIEIRIATHDLPPTYDKMYRGDFDIRSGSNKTRGGTNGSAQDYDSFLSSMAKKKGYTTTSYDKRQSDIKKAQEEIKKNYANKIAFEKNKELLRPKAMEYAKVHLPKQYKQVNDLYKQADTVTGDKRKQLRKQANKILNEIGEKYL